MAEQPSIDELLNSFNEALDFWNLGLGTAESSIQKANVQSPLLELEKLVKLMKAHTTKVGIIFKPSNVAKDPATASNTLKSLLEVSALMISVVEQLNPTEISKIFHDEIVDCSKLINGGLKKLTEELMEIMKQVETDSKHENASNNSASETDDRLMAVGIIWSNCDKLSDILKKGKLGILTLKIKSSIEFIDDGLDEFAEWLEDPTEIEGFDMGDFDDFGDDSGEEGEEGEEGEKETPSKADAATIEQITKFGTLWLEKFKLVKLLLLSVSKSLPQVTSGETINNIYETQKKIVGNIDLLISGLTIGMKVDEEVQENADNIKKQCNVLLKEVKQVNKLNENKVKWCDTWKSKFDSN